MIGKMLVLVAGAVFLAACSSPTTQGQPKGEATSTEQAAPSAGQSAVSTTEHDNNVTFLNGGCISSATFTPQDSNITGGQPWGGILTTEPYNGQVFSLDAKAGRKDSSGPAAWFNDRAPEYVAMFNGPINNLNFAFTGELTLNGDTYLITLGQGNAGGGASPWWLGGEGFQLETAQGWAHLYTPDGKYFFTSFPHETGPATDDTFYMFAANCGQDTSSTLGSESNSTNFEYTLDIQNNTKIGMDITTYDTAEGTAYRLEPGAHGRYVTRREISVDSNVVWTVAVNPDNYTPKVNQLNLFFDGIHGDFLNSDVATFAGYDQNGAAYVFGDPNNPRKNFDFSGYWNPPGGIYAIAGGGDVAQGAGFHAHITFNSGRG